MGFRGSMSGEWQRKPVGFKVMDSGSNQSDGRRKAVREFCEKKTE